MDMGAPNGNGDDGGTLAIVGSRKCQSYPANTAVLDLVPVRLLLRLGRNM